jgi:hypothetical protein
MDACHAQRRRTIPIDHSPLRKTSRRADWALHPGSRQASLRRIILRRITGIGMPRHFVSGIVRLLVGRLLGLARQFTSNDAHVARSLDAYPNRMTFNPQHRDGDVVTDSDLLLELSRQYEHGTLLVPERRVLRAI